MRICRDCREAASRKSRKNTKAAAKLRQLEIRRSRAATQSCSRALGSPSRAKALLMRAFVAVKRVVDYAVKVRVNPAKTGVDIANV